MEEIVLIIPGDPVPWAPKTGNPKMGGKFVPARQSKHAGKIIDAWERSGNEGFLRGDEPLIISCVFYVKRPKGHYGTGANADEIKERFKRLRPTGRPDLSNLVKQVEDALTTHAWADDDQVVGFYPPFGKVFTTAREEQPRTVIKIKLART